MDRDYTLERALADRQGGQRVFDVDAFRALLIDVLRAVIREELGARRSRPDEYLSVARAASVAEVTPGTIRSWIREGRLGRFRAGRELRVRRTDLERLLLGEAPGGMASPEERARAILARASRRAS
jgi:excisionase family DNA binding protein